MNCHKRKSDGGSDSGGVVKDASSVCVEEMQAFRQGRAGEGDGMMGSGSGEGKGGGGE